jgi:hypothetical protein
MDMSDQTVCTGHFTAREIALVFIEVGAGAGVDILEKR